MLQALYFQFGIKLHNVVDTQVCVVFLLLISEKWLIKLEMHIIAFYVLELPIPRNCLFEYLILHLQFISTPPRILCSQIM